MKPKFADRIASMPTSVFSTMGKLALEHKAVNLGQGFPDFDGPGWIQEEAFKAMKSGLNQYAPMNGIFTLRNNISNAFLNNYNMQWNPDTEITITAGATEALYSTITALVNPGDEVMMFEPYYDAHQADVILAGGIPTYVTLRKPDFSFDPEDLEETVSNKTKILIINNPHNPTGKVYTRSEFDQIATFAIKHNLLVISDEVYEFLTFDGIKHIPIATLPGMRDRTITISSTGKTFGMTGWKIGYAIACPELTVAVQKVHQWTTFAVNTPGQHAMAYAFSKLDGYLPDFRALYQSKRDLLFERLKETAFTPHKPDGSYFMMVDIPESAGEEDIDCSTRLVKDLGVATIPPSVFYSKSDEGKSMLRLCFAKKDETLLQGIEKLKAY
ncbi:MAG: methionine aminotransferase [Candidatus Kapabacteria bacterium]|jgi:aspartate/methionine/tyrosine aminotransferase|nr:methionine aminotransferase [Candidatus Kapabacteria bacterium]